MKIIEMIIKSSTEFYNDLKADEHDRYFVTGIRSQKIASGTYNIKSILQLVDFYEKNIEQFDSVQKILLLLICCILKWKYLIWDFGRLVLT